MRNHMPALVCQAGGQAHGGVHAFAYRGGDRNRGVGAHVTVPVAPAGTCSSPCGPAPESRDASARGRPRVSARPGGAASFLGPAVLDPDVLNTALFRVNMSVPTN